MTRSNSAISGQCGPLVSLLVLFAIVHCATSKTYVITSNSNDYCSANIDCGFESYSVCYQGKCVCQLGYHWNSNQYRCEKTICSRDNQCSKWAGAGCDVSRRRCVCQATYTHDQFSQKCVSNNPYTASRTFIFIPIAIIILLVLVAGGGGGRWYYVRSRQELIHAHEINVNQNPSPLSTAYPPYPSQTNNNNPTAHQQPGTTTQPPPPYISTMYPVIIEPNPK